MLVRDQHPSVKSSGRLFQDHMQDLWSVGGNNKAAHQAGSGHCQVTWKRLLHVLVLKAWVCHEEQLEFGTVWQSWSVPEERPGETIREDTDQLYRKPQAQGAMEKSGETMSGS